MPIVCLLSGWKGGLITGFLPGKVEYEGEEPYSNLAVFYIQMFVWATHWVPIYVAAGYFLSGRIVTHKALTPWLKADVMNDVLNWTDNINSTNSTGQQPEPENEAVWSDVSFMDMVVLPFVVLVLRQYVIAVKYAFIARGRIRSHRKKGRNMERWMDERLNAFYLDPSREMAMLSLEVLESMYRRPRNIYLEFVDPVSAQDQREWI